MIGTIRPKSAGLGSGLLRRALLGVAVAAAGLMLGGCMTTYYAPYAYSYRTGWTYYSPTRVVTAESGPYGPVVVPVPPGPYYYGPLPQPRPWAW
ncbi:hypothetical protein [Segnochrobactrum spirostomi]|uniref:Uncharacterized protein n=1 Tax=Segnochrobactrum spirostomi TaxID=2608987 RepID=A0A6A7Y801_9HYPH|nr:hypothetical protein [Segnochrobactrum spirostomi]MQT14467.1 hypothetical protein [Segnochrobactrum spirostomi]